MYDAGKVIVGIVAFLVLISAPVWYNAITLRASTPPELDLDTPAIKALKEKRCVEAREIMRADHMRMLDDWRNEVVRGGFRIYVASSGATFSMSLTETCLNCHSNKERFCDRCHQYMGVEPNCWSCHVVPKETK
jgi:hypothetical protein